MVKKDLITLAVETALPNGSLAVFKGDRELDSFIADDKTSLRSENLLEKIKHLLEKNNLQIKIIDTIVVSTGPGSFTGIRVGLATARALAFAANCRIIGMSLLDALAAGYFQRETRVVSVATAGKDRLFWREFQKADFLNEKISESKSKSHTGTIDQLVERLYKISFKGAVVVSPCSKHLATFLKSKLNGECIILNASDNVASILASTAINFFDVVNASNSFEKSFKEQPDLLAEYETEARVGRPI